LELLLARMTSVVFDMLLEILVENQGVGVASIRHLKYWGRIVISFCYQSKSWILFGRVRIAIIAI